MKRLLLVTHTAQIGGAELALLDIAQHFGARCHVLLFDDGPLVQRLADMRVSYTVLNAGRRMSDVRRAAGPLRMLMAVPAVLAMASRVRRLAREYDVLYPNTQKAAVVIMTIAPLVRRPVVWHMHDILSAEHFAPLQRRLMTRLANLSARQVIVVSEAARESFVRSGGKPGRAVVVFDGVDTDRFTRVEQRDIADLRRHLGLTNIPLLGLFGRITQWKGQHVLLRALPELPGVHALFVGDALFGETRYRNELLALANDLGVTDRVSWLGQRSDIAVLMHAVDIVVHTSVAAEPFGRVIVEGMLAGRPVLATDHGASRELLGDDPLALVPPSDSSSLARAVQHIMALSPEERAALGARNCARAERLFSLRAMLSGIERAVALEEPL